MHRRVPLQTAQIDFLAPSFPCDEEEIVRLDDIEPSILHDVIKSCDASGINGAISTINHVLTETPQQYPGQNVNDSNNYVSVFSQRNCRTGQDHLAQVENLPCHQSGSQSNSATSESVNFDSRYDHAFSWSDTLMSCHDNFNGSDDSFEVPCSDWPKCQRQCRDDVHECTFMYQAIDVQSQNCGKAIPSLTGDCRCPSTASHNAVLCTSSFSHAPCCTAASLENSYAPSFKNSNFPSSANVDQADRSRLYPLNTNATDVNNTPPIIIYSRFQKENPAEVNGKRIEVVKSSKKRGRPCTYLKYLKCDQFECDAHDKRGASNILYQFLLKELRTQQTHIKWENEQEGKFKFVDTTECSRRWGQMKKRANMNFEKLSRAMRYYYRDGLMCKVKGLRLVYQINWEVVPKEYWPQAPQLFQRLLDCRVKKM